MVCTLHTHCVRYQQINTFSIQTHSQFTHFTPENNRYGETILADNKLRLYDKMDCVWVFGYCNKVAYLFKWRIKDTIVERWSHELVIACCELTKHCIWWGNNELNLSSDFHIFHRTSLNGVVFELNEFWPKIFLDRVIELIVGFWMAM